MDKICLKQLSFMACHGVYEEEKHNPQPFCINIEMFTDTSRAAASDDLAYSTDYSQVYAQVRDLVENNCFNLLETLAERVAAIALRQPLVKRVVVEVEKSKAASGDSHFTSAVVIERE